MLSFALDAEPTVADREKHGATARATAIDVIHSLDAIELDWRRFETTALGHVFQTFDFVAPWTATVGVDRGMAPFIVVGRDACGAILFILPLGIRPRFGRRQLEWLGGEHADYHCGLFAPRFLATLAEPGAGNEFCRTIVTLAAGEADLINFIRQPATIDGLPNPFAAYRASRHADDRHETRIGACWETYYRAKRNSSSRRHDRSKLRNLTALGEVRVFDATTPEETDRVMTALFAQKERGLDKRGAAGFFASPAVRDFYSALARNPYPDGPCHVAALECGDDIVAANWGLMRGDRYYYVMHSFCGAGPAGRFSPGRHLMYHLMQWAIARGARIFDFTIGDEDFKARWCEVSQPLYDSVAALGGSSIALAAALRSGRAVKRIVKGNPTLRLAAERVRRRLPARAG